MCYNTLSIKNQKDMIGKYDINFGMNQFNLISENTDDLPALTPKECCIMMLIQGIYKNQYNDTFSGNKYKGVRLMAYYYLLKLKHSSNASLTRKESNLNIGLNSLKKKGYVYFPNKERRNFSF